MIALLLPLLIFPTAVEKPAPRVILPDGRSISVELAVTEEERATGLMYRESLPENRGMLFLFSSCSPHTFWMKNCFFPLDLIWMDDDGKVLAVVHDAPPCRSENCPSYDPEVSACYVLEINGGLAKEWMIARGMTLRFEDIPDVRTNH